MKAKFGRYVFLKRLAVGGMAEIFLARRVSFARFGRFVVIKRLLPEHRGKRAYERLFLAEARIAALLNHSNIISLHDLGKLGDAYFIAMEYVHGVSGAELMHQATQAERRIPFEVALRIAREVAEAVAYYQASPGLDGEPFRVIHHDLSSHNIQIGLDGTVKVLDFGVATRIGHSAPGGRRGKYAYMAPEALRSEVLDERADVFSLGVVLYELALGRRLFKGPTPEETLSLAEACDVPRPTEVDPACPPALEAVLLKALAADRDARYEDGAAMLKALNEAIASLGFDCSTGPLATFLESLYGEALDERRLELFDLAQAAQGSGQRRPTEREVPEDSLNLRSMLSEPSPTTPAPQITRTTLPAVGLLAPPKTQRHGAEVAPQTPSDAPALEGDQTPSPLPAELPPGANDGEEDNDWDALPQAASNAGYWLVAMVTACSLVGWLGFMAGQG